jgi:hypothetical protein
MAARANTRVTIDHEEIRRWVEERGGRPAAVKATRKKGDPGIIRIDFPGYSGDDTLEPISWDEWFKKFDQSNLAFVYQETTARGQKSNFNKLVSRESVDLKTGDTKARPPRRLRKQAQATRVGERRARRAVAARSQPGRRGSPGKRSRPQKRR